MFTLVLSDTVFHLQTSHFSNSLLLVRYGFTSVFQHWGYDPTWGHLELKWDCLWCLVIFLYMEWSIINMIKNQFCWFARNQWCHNEVTSQKMKRLCMWMINSKHVTSDDGRSASGDHLELSHDIHWHQLKRQCSWQRRILSQPGNMWLCWQAVVVLMMMMVMVMIMMMAKTVIIIITAMINNGGDEDDDDDDDTDDYYD